jgi:hypothetical protein
MFVITLLALYCAATPLAWQPVWSIGDEKLGLATVTLAIVLAGSLLTALRRLRRAAQTLRRKDA